MAKRQSISETVQAYIRDYIIQNKLNVGDQLPSENAIADTLEVSRVSVREAVKILQALGIVDVRHGNGLFVRGLNFDALLEILSYSLLVTPPALKELYQVRKLFETSMIPEVIDKMREEDIAACRAILKTWETQIRQGLPHYEQDRLFHLALCRALGNNILLELEDIFWTAYRNAEERMPGLRQQETDLMHMEGGLQAHIDVLNAIAAKDLASAERLMGRHFEGIRKRMEAILREPPTPPLDNGG